MEVYINPMIGTGVLEMTEPDNPTSRNNGKSGTRWKIHSYLPPSVHFKVIP